MDNIRTFSSLRRKVLAIVDYDAGNLRSVQRACVEVGVTAEITDSPTKIRDSDRVIFPGVGAAGPAMRSIQARGLDRAIVDAFNSGRPILGICMGLQISLQHSEEDDTQTLGIIPGRVQRFRLNDPLLKIPHMGWNSISIVNKHPIFDGLEPEDEFYFVHSYFPAPTYEEHVLATSDYEGNFCCAVSCKNFVGTQFHPEKSGRVGLRLLERFIQWSGSVA